MKAYSPFLKVFWLHRILWLHVLLASAIFSPFAFRSCSEYRKKKDHEWFVAAREKVGFLAWMAQISVENFPENATSWEDLLGKTDFEKLDEALWELHFNGMFCTSLEGIVINADFTFWRKLADFYRENGIDEKRWNLETFEKRHSLYEETSAVLFYRKSHNPFMKYRYLCWSPGKGVFQMNEKPNITIWKPSRDITVRIPALPERRAYGYRPRMQAIWPAAPERVFVFKAAK